MKSEGLNIQNGDKMKTMLDVRNLLKRFGIFIYTGDRKGDAELMEMELTELYNQGLVMKDEYLQARVLLLKEKEKYR